MFLNGYWMNPWDPIGCGNRKLDACVHDILGSHRCWKDLGCVLGRILDELMGLPGYGNDLGCALGRILYELLGSHWFGKDLGCIVGRRFDGTPVLPWDWGRISNAFLGGCWTELG